MIAGAANNVVCDLPRRGNLTFSVSGDTGCPFVASLFALYAQRPDISDSPCHRKRTEQLFIITHFHQLPNIT